MDYFILYKGLEKFLGSEDGSPHRSITVAHKGDFTGHILEHHVFSPMLKGDLILVI